MTCFSFMKITSFNLTLIYFLFGMNLCFPMFQKTFIKKINSKPQEIKERRSQSLPPLCRKPEITNLREDQNQFFQKFDKLFKINEKCNFVLFLVPELFDNLNIRDPRELLILSDSNDRKSTTTKDYEKTNVCLLKEISQKKQEDRLCNLIVEEGKELSFILKPEEIIPHKRTLISINPLINALNKDRYTLPGQMETNWDIDNIDDVQSTGKPIHPYTKTYHLSLKKNKEYKPSSRVFVSVTAKKLL